MNIHEITEDAYIHLTSDTDKACKCCVHRLKDNGTLGSSKAEVSANVYGCYLGQQGLTKCVSQLPVDCKAKNIVIAKQSTEHKVKSMDNCAMCRLCSDGNEICNDKRINVTYCPCKNCDSFMTGSDGDCFNYTPKCKERIKFEAVKNEE
jgi:hypothetical protein